MYAVCDKNGLFASLKIVCIDWKSYPLNVCTNGLLFY